MNPIKEETELTEEQKVTAQLADNLVELLAKQSQNTEEKCEFFKNMVTDSSDLILAS